MNAPGRLPRVPNKPKTPVSGFRIPLDLKARCAAKAEAEGKTLTEVVIEALKRYDRRTR